MKILSRWLLLLAVAAPGMAAASTAPSLAPGSLAIHLEPLGPAAHAVAGGDAFLDLGTLWAQGDDLGRGIVVRRRIAVRLEAGPGAPASARLSVSLTDETLGYRVRVAGVTLSALPRVVDPVHRVGTAVAYDVEVTVAPSVAPGSLISELRWLAETE